MSARPRYAVIGTGAAALGVLDALLYEGRGCDITLIDVGDSRGPSGPTAHGDDASEIAAFYEGLYRQLFARQRRSFPPPKTHFGESIPRHRMDSGQTLYKSETLGGLTKYWGGTLLPFTDAETRTWPIQARQLAPYYARIADRVGLAGGDDALLQYFGRDYATRPGIRPLEGLRRLCEAVNGANAATAGYRVLAGVNRCAVDTRKESAGACIYCGECMAGCVKGSIFSSAQTVASLIEAGKIDRLIQGRVARIDLARRAVFAETAAGTEQLTGFSKIFLCAGCIGSTEIVLRSTGMTGEALMTDNSVHVFPVFYFGRGMEADASRYFGLCNVILACVPERAGGHLAQVQIYPNFDYMWRYNTPAFLWRMLAPLVRASRGHVFWARLYLHSGVSQSYRLRLENDRLTIGEVRATSAGAEAKRLMGAIRQAVNKDGFFVPPIPPIPQRTNSHYGGTLPFGGTAAAVPTSGEIGNGVYLCDSSTFPDTPAVSPTFTLMANAARIAAEAIHG